jgi:hypothetical protein
MLIIVLILTITILYIFSIENFTDKIPCIKWSGNIQTSPTYICKDCGYPEDCHGPYKGDSWRHIFREIPL